VRNNKEKWEIGFVEYIGLYGWFAIYLIPNSKFLTPNYTKGVLI